MDGGFSIPRGGAGELELVPPVTEGERDDRGVPYHAESTLSSAQAQVLNIALLGSLDSSLGWTSVLGSVFLVHDQLLPAFTRRLMGSEGRMSMTTSHIPDTTAE